MKIPDSLEAFDDVERLQYAVADAFCDLVTSTLGHADRFRVSLSGGSTPQRIYELIADRALPWERIHWFWGDERNVPHDHEDSNAGMVQRTLLSKIDSPPQNVHRVPVDPSDPATAAQQYEQTLREHFPDEPFPKWELNLLGMGDDAHTASLFPDSDALGNAKRWFVENWVEKFDAFRYTLTAPAINSSEQTWFLIAGANKRAALTSVLGSERAPLTYPAQLIDADRWFVTADALPGKT